MDSSEVAEEIFNKLDDEICGREALEFVAE